MLEEDELTELKSRLKQVFSGYSEIAGGKNYRYMHLNTTRKIALNLEEELDVAVDKEVLEVASLYHDIGRSEDIEDGEMDPFEGHEGHDRRGAEIVGEYVSDFLTENQLKKVEKIIRNHHSKPETVEGRIVQDADKISNFGVNNLWRQFHYAAHHKRSLYEGLNYFKNTAIGEYKEKIGKLHFEKSKEIARKRLEKHENAVKQIEKEIKAKDF